VGNEQASGEDDELNAPGIGGGIAGQPMSGGARRKTAGNPLGKEAIEPPRISTPSAEKAQPKAPNSSRRVVSRPGISSVLLHLRESEAGL
jgi:hypothetical protein